MVAHEINIEDFGISYCLLKKLPQNRCNRHTWHVHVSKMTVKRTSNEKNYVLRKSSLTMDLIMTQTIQISMQTNHISSFISIT